MNDKTIAELRELATLCCSDDGEGTWWQARILGILSSAEQGEDKDEPLAVLADRKGFYLSTCIHRAVYGDWYISYAPKGSEQGTYSDGPTYALAEAKAREYLNTLPNAKGGK